MKIVIFGSGYVGLVTGACLSDVGHEVVCVDIDADRVAALKRDTRASWDDIDVLVVPTTPTIYTKAEILADPIRLNAQLGIYTNFVNLMGLCGMAVPNGFRPDGMPQGITFLAPSWQDAKVASYGAAYHAATGLTLGATDNPQPA